MKKGGVRVHACAEGCSALFAVAAAAVGNVERHHNPVTLFEKGDAGTGFDDDAHVFMSYVEPQPLPLLLQHGYCENLVRFGAVKTNQSITLLLQMCVLETCDSLTHI